jgi:hypothetical protein
MIFDGERRKNLLDVGGDIAFWDQVAGKRRCDALISSKGAGASSAGVHSRDHDRARDADVTSGGRAEIRAHGGADQPGSRTGHDRVAKEQELIMPKDVRFTTATTLSQSPSFRLSNSSRCRGTG